MTKAKSLSEALLGTEGREASLPTNRVGTDLFVEKPLPRPLHFSSRMAALGVHWDQQDALAAEERRLLERAGYVEHSDSELTPRKAAPAAELFQNELRQRRRRVVVRRSTYGGY